jgi:hypothetical protein
MDDDRSTRRYNMAASAAFIVAIVLGAAVWYYTGNFINAVFTILLVSGLYLAVSFYLRDRKERSNGPSEFGAAIMGGVLLAGIGASGFVYSFTQDVTITVICLIAAFIASSIVMVTFYRKYL